MGALSRGSCSYWFGRLVLAANGLDPDRDVELVGLNERYPKVVDLFESGEKFPEEWALGAEIGGPRRIGNDVGSHR